MFIMFIRYIITLIAYTVPYFLYEINFIIKVIIITNLSYFIRNHFYPSYPIIKIYYQK